jgi:hypothetical protein
MDKFSYSSSAIRKHKPHSKHHLFKLKRRKRKTGNHHQHHHHHHHLQPCVELGGPSSLVATPFSYYNLFFSDRHSVHRLRPVRSFVLIKSSTPSMVGRVEFNNDRFRGSKTLQHQWLPVGAEFIQDQIRFKISVKDTKEKISGWGGGGGFLHFYYNDHRAGSLVGFMHGGCWTEFG